MTPILGFTLGVALLVFGGDLLVRGASRLALAFQISPLVVGLTVVAFGTSAPELAVSVQSVMKGQVDLATGNVVGSNIFNVLFILGISAIITPLLVNRQLIRQEVPIMVAASLLVLWMASDGLISLVDGLILTSLLIVYIVITVVQSRRRTRAEQALEGATDESTGGWADHWAVQILFILVGLGLLVLGSNWLVEAAVSFARSLGVSELVIGLTIVAVGTSLPEVATSIIAAVRGERDMAVGNVVGSNIFNLLCVLGISSVVSVSGITAAPALMAFDIPFMVAVAFACLPVFFTGYLIARWEGMLFLLVWIAYTTYLVFAATQNALLPAYSTAMLMFVTPVVVVTLAVLVTREWLARRAVR